MEQIFSIVVRIKVNPQYYLVYIKVVNNRVKACIKIVKEVNNLEMKKHSNKSLALMK